MMTCNQIHAYVKAIALTAIAGLAYPFIVAFSPPILLLFFVFSDGCDEFKGVVYSVYLGIWKDIADLWRGAYGV